MTGRCTCCGLPSLIDGPQEDCPVHGTIDCILASGRYVDRRGREWKMGKRWYDRWSPVGGSYGLHRHQMRLLIERDQHRDNCPGLHECDDHPVHFVWVHRSPRSGALTEYVIYEPHKFDSEAGYSINLAEAIAAAEELSKENMK